MARWIRPTTRFALYHRDGFECAYCGSQVTINQAELDHVRPRQNGGSNKHQNLVTSCPSCNRAKGTKSLSEFAAIVAAARAERIAIHTAPSGSTWDEVEAVAADLAAEIATEIVRRVRRQTRRQTPRARGRMTAAIVEKRRVKAA